MLTYEEKSLRNSFVNKCRKINFSILCVYRKTTDVNDLTQPTWLPSLRDFQQFCPIYSTQVTGLPAPFYIRRKSSTSVLHKRIFFLLKWHASFQSINVLVTFGYQSLHSISFSYLWLTSYLTCMYFFDLRVFNHDSAYISHRAQTVGCVFYRDFLVLKNIKTTHSCTAMCNSSNFGATSQFMNFWLA